MNNKAIDSKYINSELTHEIIGSCFDVQNEVGFGHPEKTYCQLLEKELWRRRIRCRREAVVDLMYKGEKAGKRRFDFVVEGKEGDVVLEIKVGSHLSRNDYDQLFQYLKMSGIKLGLLVLFTGKEVKVSRVVNLYQ